MVVQAKDEAYLEAVIPKRIELFESIQAEQRAARQSLPSFDPIRITLSDGKVKEGKKWITSPFEIASEISKSLASNALISQVNGVLWDMNRPLEGDAELRLFTLDSFDNNEDVRHTFWHDRHLRWSMDAGSALVRVPELKQDTICVPLAKRVSTMMHFMEILA